MNNRRFISLLVAGLALPSFLAGAAEREGIRPLGKDGQPLNLNFETGTLKDWTATGKAFEGQPVKGDTVAPRRADMKSNHEGQYWIGTYEVGGDALQGTLTSVPFKVTEPFASFLFAGGTSPTTAIEIIQADNKEVIFKSSAFEAETLRPVVVDLTKVQGKEIIVRLVDQHGGGWGHINFDDFRFHKTRPKLENEFDPKKSNPDMPAVDKVKFAGLSPEDAAKFSTVPEGFRMHMFAAEPDVKQPIAFALDHRGRMWVAEAYTYPRRAPEGQGKDRILILEDTDGDHKFDKRTVFMEGLNLVSGLEVGFDGVYVGAAPYLMFIADKNHDDKPDGKPEILLDGWAYQDTHETLNTFAWGPDGWLYGCHGVFTHSNVGKPGAPDAERTRINAGIWRFHPTRHQFEVFSEGTSNPWGIDFDKNGQVFIEACVIPHLFHMIQGARYERQAGQHFNPHIYEDIKNIGDHVHYAGNKGPHAGNNRSDEAGGGHAHAGLMVYEGGSFPEQYNGKIFMNNIHGQRLNMDIPERKGSGYVGRHGKDFVNFNDTWSQVLNMIYDQDGSVFIVDWYDANQCHHNNVDGHDRSNGRIFKLVYGDAKGTQVDLTKKSNAELLKLHNHKNQWFVRHARRVLQERNAGKEVASELVKLIKSNAPANERLQYLWTLAAVGQLNDSNGLQFLKDGDEYIRAWTIQFLSEDKATDVALKEFATMATADPSPVVRLYLASALQRVAPQKRWDVLAGLLSHAEDVNDHNLPLMYWYAAEGAVASDKTRGLKLMTQSKIPKIRQFIARRVASDSKPVAANK